MTVQEFIETGLLEKYVLGLATPQEVQGVEGWIADSALVREELMAIEDALENYIHLRSVPVSEDFGAKVLQRIESQTPSPPPHNNQNGSSSNKGWLGFLGLLLLGSIAGLFWLFQQKGQLQQDLETSQGSFALLQSDCDSVRQSNENLFEQVQILQNLNNRTILLQGTEKAPNAIARVYWNHETQKSYLNTLSLPTPPSDKQYQLWAIVDGTPVDMGVFDPIDQNELQEVPFIENPQAFAVTLEPRGGVESPTLEEMVVIGNFS